MKFMMKVSIITVLFVVLMIWGTVAFEITSSVRNANASLPSIGQYQLSCAQNGKTLLVECYRVDTMSGQTMKVK